MVFIAFLVPLGLYLLFLGWINRQPRPVVVSGTWDFIGLLFGLSGFLLVGGPAALSMFNERWRYFWIVGDTGDVTDGLDGAHRIALMLAVVYFVSVVAICAITFFQRRRFTSIYNVETVTVEESLLVGCEEVGLEPIRSGNLFVFGLILEPPARNASGLQGPHALQMGKSTSRESAVEESALAQTLATHHVVLEVESFEPLKHVTLRWDPPTSPLRRVLETDLERRLGRQGAPYHDTGAWLGLVGSMLLGAALLIAFALTLRQLYMR